MLGFQIKYYKSKTPSNVELYKILNNMKVHVWLDIRNEIIFFIFIRRNEILIVQ